MAGHSSQVSAVVVGAGNRGTNYASYAKDHPEKLKITAVADPKQFPRERLKQWFSIPSELCFTSWTEVAAKGKIADCVIISVHDRLHKEPAIAFAKLKYHILLEKPMAVTKDECIEIEKACRENEVMLVVCHVLRYLPPVLAIKQCIADGVIGEVVNIQHSENVGYWHFAHSFVRGNWRNAQESSFSLLAKCCHDIDLINYWIGDKKCVKISSFGSLLHFRKDNKPNGAGDRCLDCDVEETCAYSAKKIYLDRYIDGTEARWPLSVVCNPSANFRADLTNALSHGPYGRCVYSCDNNVCDNQTVQFQYDNGSTATLTMIAFTEKLCQRETKIFGTKGELFWNGESEGPVVHFDFLTKTRTHLPVKPVETNLGSLEGHGGGDFFLMDSFVKAVSKGCRNGIHTSAADALESHLLVFAAEESRLHGTVIDYQKYKNS